MTIDQLITYRHKADTLQLIGKVYLELPLDVINHASNGIGPEWLPEPIVDCISVLHPSLFLSSLIHDLMYWLADGSLACFDYANNVFLANGKIIAYSYHFLNPRRYLVLADALKFYKLVDIGGKFAYTVAVDDCTRYIAEHSDYADIIANMRYHS